MDLVRTGEASLYPLVASMANSTFSLDPDGEWALEKKSDTEVVARWSSAELEVTKRFRLLPDSYAVELNVQVTNNSQREAEQRLQVHVFGYQDPGAPTSGGIFKYAPPAWEAACHVNGELNTHSLSSLRPGPKSYSGYVRWIGMRHKYFLLAVIPKADVRDSFACSSLAVEGKSGMMEGQVTWPAWKLKPGDSGVASTVVFVGPKILDEIEAVSQLAANADLASSVDWGPPPTSWFTFIARPMLWLLKVFHGWVRNWGVAIILLTITVKLLTLYWTHKSMKSMKAMSRLKPKLDAIREKWADDKQRQNMEMMNLYKSEGINPLGGCLPMLLQMPIWMALYSTLSAAAELYQAPFVGWIRDLTAPDPYFIFPVALTVLMFVQAKMSPASMDAAQQKMLQYMMPVMFGLFSLFFPSGLTVYIFTNTILGMAHQLYMNKTDGTSSSPAPKGVPGARKKMARA